MHGRTTVIASQRELNPVVSRCCGYEFEDVAASLEGSTMVCARHGAFSAGMVRVVDHATRRLTLAGFVNPGMKRLDVRHRADLFFALFQAPRDIVSLNALGGWRTNSDAAVCVVEEVWASSADRYWRQLRPLRMFDHIFTECLSSVERIQDITGVPTSYLPPGVDALTFAPTDPGAPRPIDVMSTGRRSAVTHEVLLERARRDPGFFYFYDTIKAKQVWSPSEHRLRLAHLLQRTRYFGANSAKFDRGFGAEIGFRFFEGVAGGAILVGTPPDTPMFDELFGWEDSIFRLPYHSTEILDLIEELDAQPDRIAAARRRNVANALRRHDWVYRWRTVLASVGMEPNEAAHARIDALQERAAALEPLADAVLATAGRSTP